MNLSKFHYQLVVFPIFLFVMVFMLWASLMHIGEFVRGYGKIVPSGQVKKVQHLEGGIISEILVKEGEQVREGQVIYRIRNEFAISNLSELQIDLNSKLASESRLRAELSGAEEIQFPAQITEKFPNIVDNEKRLFLQRKSNFNNSIRVLEQQTEQKRLQLQEDRAKSKNLNIQYDYAREQQKILERLVQSGAGSQKELIDSKLKTQNLLTELEDTQNRMLTNQKAIEESQSRVEEAKTKFLVDVQTELSNVLVAIEKLKEQISANRDKVLRTDIVSPVDGVVKTMYYNTIGGIIKPGDTVADIIPSNEILLIEARIQPQDRARIWPGQKVNIKVTAYDSSIHGQLLGVISDISADTFLDEGTRQPYYAVKVESNVRGFGSGKPLYPGMVAEVDIVAGERTVMSYLMKPILKIFDTSLTEP
ncbi:MAG: HlyD family type I secretion periplasmic adaptor subunit [Alphaproteobacteria bacterium]|nr:HlyD family type I secretion periplasmic adaptor subunit [Alphaproteobacteria bacterium]